ncbi:serine/threonine protein kinase [Yinghuangia sp. ASG 101]|uniref:serine/threonine protein kinase n=1 Tax=Yinghuangia sp. ASG 101 TaxID=2896848 RepID=UPI001E2B8FD1|nr:serine/threonine protein kinase [Yinghuangia sp. ASG 101]UGQ08883.1 serine/threonine protein kinase [Yinghuangia sp. ASG 101]
MTDRTAGSVQMADGPSGSVEGPGGSEEAPETQQTPEVRDGQQARDTGDSQETADELTMETPEKAAASPASAGEAESSDEVVAVSTPSTPPADSASSSNNTGQPTQLSAPSGDFIAEDDEIPEAAGEDGTDAEAAPAPAPPSPAPASAARNAATERLPAGRNVADVPRGTRFADRYRLEDKLSSGGKSVTWRAVDEKLRRAVGIHIVAAGSEHARSVTAAARAAALVGDPRFVHVLDTAEEDGLVYVVKEWLPDADNLASLLAVNPLPPHESYEMVRSVAEAMSVAHRAGLSHLRLDPENVLRMHTGQYKIVGLSVEAALYGHDTTDAARDDTRAIGSLLYACLARRWPDGKAFGLPEAPRNGTRLCTPGQVKAHVHGPLEAIAMRALGHEYKNQPPFDTAEDIVTALLAIPPVLPPEPTVPVSAAGADFDDEYTPAAMLDKGGPGHRPPTAFRPAASPPPPALGGGVGQAVKVLVSVIVLVAVILATWQIAAHVNSDKDDKPDPAPTVSTDNDTPGPAPAPPAAEPKPLTVRGAYEFDPYGAGQDVDGVKNSYDGNPSTGWRTKSYQDPQLQRLKPGLGVVYDLGETVDLKSVDVLLRFAGPGTTFEVRAAPENATARPNSAPGGENAFRTVGTVHSESGAEYTVDLKEPVKTRYVLIWFTALPQQPSDEFSQPGLKNGINEIGFTG